MKEKIILDTNILISSPEIIKEILSQNSESKILIPFIVLQELDKLKYDKNIGYMARNAIKELATQVENYPDRIILEELNPSELENDNNFSNDIKILLTAKKNNAVVYTQDISMSIISKSLGVETKIFNFYKTEELFNPEINLSTEESLNTFFKDIKNPFQKEYSGRDLIKIARNIKNYILKEKNIIKDAAWRYFIFSNEKGKVDYVYIYNPKKKILEEINNNKEYKSIENTLYKLNAKDVYQKIAIYLLKNAPNVLILGKYGSGKSLLATAFAINESPDRKILISRPNIGLDSRFEIGYLPGDKNDKLIEYKSGFLSSLYYLFGNTRGQKANGVSYDLVREELFYKYFEIIPINMIQGNSIHDMFYIVDEAQFLNISYLVMILSRMSENSKLILLGDLNQNYNVIKQSESGLLKLLKLFNQDVNKLEDRFSKNFKSELGIVYLRNQYRNKLVEIAELLQNQIADFTQFQL